MVFSIKASVNIGCGSRSTGSIYEGFSGVYKKNANEAIGEIDRDFELIVQELGRQTSP